MGGARLRVHLVDAVSSIADVEQPATATTPRPQIKGELEGSL